MTKRFTRAALAAVVAVAIVAGGPVATASAQSDRGDAHPGVVTIDWQQYFDREPTVVVQVTPTLLRFMTAMATEAANELGEVRGLQEIISQVKMVHVEVYEGAVDPSELAEEANALESAGWERIVRARDGDQHADVLVLARGDLIVGVVVLASESDEMAFVNVAGDFDPESLGKHLGAVAREASKGKIKLKQEINVDALKALIVEEVEVREADDEEDDD